MKNAFTAQAVEKAPDARPQAPREPERTWGVREDSRGAENAADGLFQQPVRANLLTDTSPEDILKDMARKRILVVDDSATTRRFLSTTLSQAGYDVREVQGGPEALENLREAAFDLVILDVEMPQLSGFEVLRIMKSATPWKSIPVLVITGVHKDLSHVHKLRQLGADGFIDKDTPSEQLLFRVGQLIPPS